MNVHYKDYLRQWRLWLYFLINDALKHIYPGDDTLTALAQLSAIFENKFQKPLAPKSLQSPIRAAENKCPVALLQQVLTSPVKHNYQTILQTQRSPTALSNVIESQNLPQLPRVVTPAVRSASPPRVPARARNPENRPRIIYWIWEVPISIYH
jgi:hypothetical protein